MLGKLAVGVCGSSSVACFSVGLKAGQAFDSGSWRRAELCNVFIHRSVKENSSSCAMDVEDVTRASDVSLPRWLQTRGHFQELGVEDSRLPRRRTTKPMRGGTT